LLAGDHHPPTPSRHYAPQMAVERKRKGKREKWKRNSGETETTRESPNSPRGVNGVNGVNGEGEAAMVDASWGSVEFNGAR